MSNDIMYSKVTQITFASTDNTRHQMILKLCTYLTMVKFNQAISPSSLPFYPDPHTMCFRQGLTTPVYYVRSVDVKVAPIYMYIERDMPAAMCLKITGSPSDQVTIQHLAHPVKPRMLCVTVDTMLRMCADIHSWSSINCDTDGPLLVQLQLFRAYWLIRKPCICHDSSALQMGRKWPSSQIKEQKTH